MSSGGCCFGTATDCNNNVIYNLKDCVKTTYHHLRYLNANSRGIDLPESFMYGIIHLYENGKPFCCYNNKKLVVFCTLITSSNTRSCVSFKIIKVVRIAFFKIISLVLKCYS